MTVGHARSRLCTLLLLATAVLTVRSADAQEAAAEAPASASTDAEDGNAGDGESAADGDKSAEGADAPPATEEGPKVVGAEVFEQGVVAYKSGSEQEAAKLLFTYMKGNDPAADHYEYAELYLAKNFERMGLYHGAVEYYFNVAREQKRPELLPEALRSIERIATSRPYDRLLITRDLLGSSDFGTLPPDVKTFVAYHQGLRDLQQGRQKWAERHFAVLDRADPSRSPLARRYVVKAKFARALQQLTDTHAKESQAKRDLRAEALKQLTEIAEDPELKDLTLKNDARRTVARLHYEEGRFDDALKYYDSIEVPFLSRAEADIFLEKAWARFMKGDYRGTLGILLSLDAPSYRKHFRPERFLLKALAYEGLCHYAASKGAAREFLRRYGSSLDELRRSRDPLADPAIRRAVVSRPRPKAMYRYLRSLQREREEVEGLDFDSGLRSHMVRMYDLKIAEANRRLDTVVRQEGERVAEELLDYEEQARLVDYEISLEVFQRVRKASNRVPKAEPAIPIGSRQVYYQFNGEYWNDELHDYRFRIEDRCFGEKLFR